MAVDFVTPGWDFDGVEHGFAGRDEPVAPRLAPRMRLVRVRQVHGADVIVADDATPEHAGDADALITETRGVAVGVATADCVPVLLVAPEAGVVAAVHAGWRGSLAGIVPRAIRIFVERFDVDAGDIRAALGPSIGACCYEVEREIAERFVDRHGSEMWSAWTDGAPGKGTLDLRTVNEKLLLNEGVRAGAILQVGPCTGCGGADLASYRVQGTDAGRQLSWIGLR